MTDTREFRTYKTGQIVVAFARVGVAIEKMARALVIPRTQIESICRRAIERDEMQMMPPLSADDTRSASYSELVELRRRLDVAEALLAEHAAERDQKMEFMRIGGFSRREAVLVATLVDRGTVSKTGLYEAMYGSAPDADQPDPKIVDVYVCKIRKKLAKFGVTIDTLWGSGYAISADNVLKLRREAGLDAPSIVPEPVPA